MHRHRDDGFTLVELLIVVVIFGILAGIAVFAVGSLSGDARSKECTAEEQTLDKAITAYVAAHPGTDRTTVTLAQLMAGPSPVIKTDPSARWDIVAGEPSALGACA